MSSDSHVPTAVQFVKNVKCHWTVENVADFLENRLPHLDFSVDTWSYQRKTALELLVGDKTRHSSRDKLVMCLLLKHGANPLKCRSRETIMQRILRHKDSALIINFLMFVKDINIFHGGSTALHIAVSRRLKDVVEYIISRNELNINMRTNGKWTALHEATKAGRLDIIKTLLDNGADVEARDEAGQTPLHWAVRFHSSMDLVKTLVESGADVNSKDEYGCTPLHILCTKGAGVNMDIFDLLLQKMDNPNTEDSKGSTPIHNLMRLLPVNSLPRNKKLVELFLKYGGSLNKEDGIFGTVLHVAACSNHSANFLMFLMEKGAYACILNGANLTFLDYIIRSDRKKVKEIVKNMIVQEFKGRFDLDPLLLNCVRTDREINEYVRSCKIELCLLNGRQLGNEKQVSLFTVLSSDDRTLANIFRNALTRNEMAKFHRRKFPMFKKKIPIYGRNLICNYKLGLKRMQSENIFHDFLTRIGGNDLSIYSVEEIIRLCPTEEMIKLKPISFQRSAPIKSLITERVANFRNHNADNFVRNILFSIHLYIFVYLITISFKSDI
ncbi:ankyrin-3-like [Coccinella septempunctata]|uniref:ankyrin-3-like n=1 Tax=Coccinella septempunctata TaxID=41139 RepID=UPI001D06B658|nr:ankyrin-3-like [Coccinella septempunctata]